MKKFLLTVTSLLMFSAVSFAQNVNAALYKSRIEKSNSDIKDPKKNVKASTWMTRGKAFYDTAIANNFKIFVGMPETEMIEKVGNPVNAKEIPVESYGGVNYLKYHYNDVDIFLTADKKTVAFWVETNPIYPNALEESRAAYAKAYEMDPASEKKVADALKKIVTAYTNTATNMNIIGNTKEAGKNFGAAYEIGSLSIVNEPKANSWAYYAGALGAMNGDNDAAIKYLTPLAGTYEEELAEDKGNTYYFLGYAHHQKGEDAEAEKYYLQGIEKYPANQRLLQDLISLYISTKQDPAKVIPYIKKGQETDPNNAVFYLAEGLAYNTMQDYEKAIQAFEGALKVSPEYFEALYSIGVAYYSKAAKLNEELNTVDFTNTTLRDELTASILDTYKKAVPAFEKAHSVNPKDPSTVEYLKSIYFVLRDESPEMQANYDKYNELFKSM